MNSIPGLVIRPALLSDYSGVMDIDNSTWHKLDYLPTIYNQFLDDPTANCFIAEISGKVVGFYNLQRAEGDTAAVSVGIRIDPDHQRKGIATALKKTTLDVVSKQGPILKTRLRQTLSTDYLEGVLAEPANPEKILRRYMTTGLWTTYESLSSGLQDQIVDSPSFGSDDTIHSFSDDETGELLTSPNAMSSIFIGPYFIASHNWFPFCCTPDNIKAMIASHKVFCSTDISGSICNATSYGICLQTENGPRYTLYFLPKPGSQGLFLSHAQKHLSHFLTLAEGSENVTFSMEIPVEFSDSLDWDVFNKMFGSDVQVGWRATVLLLEENLSLQPNMH